MTAFASGLGVAAALHARGKFKMLKTQNSNPVCKLDPRQNSRKQDTSFFNLPLEALSNGD